MAKEQTAVADKYWVWKASVFSYPKFVSHGCLLFCQVFWDNICRGPFIISTRWRQFFNTQNCLIIVLASPVLIEARSFHTQNFFEIGLCIHLFVDKGHCIQNIGWPQFFLHNNGQPLSFHAEYWQPGLFVSKIIHPCAFRTFYSSF